VLQSELAQPAEPRVESIRPATTHAVHAVERAPARPGKQPLAPLPQPIATLSVEPPRRPEASRAPASASALAQAPTTPDIRIGTIALEIRAAPPIPVAPPVRAAAASASAPATPSFSMRRHYLRGG
jgi:hypothetical protein